MSDIYLLKLAPNLILISVIFDCSPGTFLNGKHQFHPIGLGKIVCSDAETSVFLLPIASEGDMAASFRTLVEGPTIASVKLGLLGCDAM